MSNLSKWIRTGEKERGDLEEDSYKILSQFYKERKDLFYHTADGVVACGRKDLRMKNYNELSDNKQVCIVPNPNSQSAAILVKSFSITKSGLCVSVLLNTLDIPITIQRERKLGYTLPVKTICEMTENVKEDDILDCPNHRDKICILNLGHKREVDPTTRTVGHRGRLECKTN